MAKATACKSIKKITSLPSKASQKAMAGASAPVVTPGALGIFFDQKDTFTVVGQTASGQDAVLDGLATMTVTTSDASVVTLNPVVGLSETMVGVKGAAPSATPRHADLAITVTMTDGSGVFTATQGVDVSDDPVTGIKITLGTPVPA